MKTIYKYPLVPGSLGNLVPLPKMAHVLCVQMQGDDLMLWSVVDAEERETENRRFVGYMTGEMLPDDPGKYIGTVQTVRYGIVIHVFEVWP